MDQLIRAYRVRGHLVADLDPLGRPRPPQVELDPAFHGLTEAHRDLVFSTRTIYPHETLSLRAILEHLRNRVSRGLLLAPFRHPRVSVRNSARLHRGPRDAMLRRWSGITAWTSIRCSSRMPKEV